MASKKPEATLQAANLQQSFLFGHKPQVAVQAPPPKPPPVKEPEIPRDQHDEVEPGVTKEYRIHGPPGTGKSSTLARVWIPRAVNRFGAEAVIVSSLTNAAAHEIAAKADTLPRENIGTLHGHIYRAMGTPELAVSKMKEWNTEYPIWAMTGKAIRGDEEMPSEDGEGEITENGDTLMQRAEILRHTMTPIEAWPEDVTAFYQCWRDWKEQQGLLDFTDLIEAAVRDPAMLGSRPKVFIGDEAQDHTLLEITTVRQWADRAAYAVFAGDADQTIYGWRGASPQSFLGRPIPPAHNKHLTQSFRVPRAVHAAARAWINKVQNRYVVNYEPAPRDGELILAPGLNARRGDWIIEEVEKDLERGMSVMLIASCAYQINYVAYALRSAGVLFHNPMRKENGAWNPLRGGVDRIKALLRPLPEIYGDQARVWNFKEVWRWVQPLRAKGVIQRGMKAEVEAMAKQKATDVWTGLPSVVDMNWIAKVLTEPAAKSLCAARAKGPTAMVEWFVDHASEDSVVSLRYGRDVVERHGAKILTEEPRTVVGTIHCSPPDEMIATKRGDVPIAELRPDDRLVGWHRGTNSVLGNRPKKGTGYGFTRSERHYSGPLITIETDRSRTRVTPNHRVVARFDDSAFCERWAVYLMRRGDWWRVGICVTAHRPYKSGGVAGRLATEEADHGWILSVHETRREALMEECRVQGKYGIPGLTFTASKGRALNDADLAAIHGACAGSVRPRAIALLADRGLSESWPLYIRGDFEGQGKRNMRGNFVTEAANLVALSGRFKMLTLPAEGRMAVPRRAVVGSSHYEGMVYGLDVPPHHFYGSGGAIVHNSVKGGEADSVYVFPDLSNSGMKEWHGSDDSRDALVRLFYVAMTRARQKLTLCGAYSRCPIDWPQMGLTE